MRMELPAVALISVGGYLIDSGIKNRAPIGTIRALIADPSDIAGTFKRMAGNWTQSGVTDFDSNTGILNPGPNAPGTAASNSGSGTGSGSSAKGWSQPGVSGKLSATDLSGVKFSPGARLIPGAARSLEALNKAFKAKFGNNISITSSYRSYAAQVATKAAKGSLAATPGTSNHGWGRAVDLGSGINHFGSATYNWMMENAPKYGWVKPDWSRQGGVNPEPWHWEYIGGNSTASTTDNSDVHRSVLN